MKHLDTLWDDNPIDITQEANFIWSIANKLRGSYMPDKYGDVIIPMTIIRRLECALLPSKQKVIETYKKNRQYPAKAMYKISGYQFYNTSSFTLAELCNDADHIKENFKSYISGFSSNVRDILTELEMPKHIDKMDKDGCLYNVVKAFSELDLSPAAYDSIKMGYIFENLIGRFFQNVDAGQYYTGRDIIKLCVSLLISEGCDDIFDDGKIITVCDEACGTGGMLSTAFNYLKHYNPTADVRLFGQELMGVSYAVGLAEMLIKGQDAENFRHADTFKQDCFPETKMRFLLENPPFGTPWGGKDSKDGQEAAVIAEYEKAKKGQKSRWGAGLPGSGDGQLLFIQSAIDKMDSHLGRGAIIENGSPLFSGGTSSGESQIRRFLLENDLIEAIVQLPADLFYNTGITTYIWVLSKNKRPERRGKIQLIDASGIYHKLRKALGNKRNEITPEDRAKITHLYADFKANELCRIYDNTEFIYKEYTVMQPLQRSYAITQERIDELLQAGTLNNLYNEIAVMELENIPNPTDKDAKKLANFQANKPVFDNIISTLKAHISGQIFKSPEPFIKHLTDILKSVTTDKKLIEKIAKGLSVMDKTAEIQKDKKGNVIYDKETKDTEIVKWSEDIDTYMQREVLPHIPDAQAFWEENLNAKKPVIKTGAEIPFTRYFYKYESIRPAEEYLQKFLRLQEQVEKSLQELKK